MSKEKITENRSGLTYKIIRQKKWYKYIEKM